MAAGTFYRAGYTHVAEIQEVYHTLTPLWEPGCPLWRKPWLLFRETAHPARPWRARSSWRDFSTCGGRLRRLITRLLAIIPSLLRWIFSRGGTAKLLILSQVILSLNPFRRRPPRAVTGDRRMMGQFVNPRWLKILAWHHGRVICYFNVSFGCFGFEQDQVIGRSGYSG